MQAETLNFALPVLMVAVSLGLGRDVILGFIAGFGLRLRYLEGLPSKEIADRLGKSDGAVRVMLTRSLDKLQKLLAETE